MAKTDQVQQAIDIAVSFLDIEKKTKYNITREDGWRVNFQKIRNRPLKKHPITDRDMEIVQNLLKIKKSPIEIAKILGLTKRRVVNVIQKINHYEWIPDRESVKKHSAQVVELRKEGYSHQQIRDKLHISGTTIVYILRSHKMGGERHSKRDEN